MRILSELISSLDVKNPNFRPTEIFNESWLVKLVLWQASTMPDNDFPLGFLPESSWFSEALLPTAFKARFRGDQLAESRTNADGVIGHFLIGERAKADFELKDNPQQFTVVEAKIGSPLSKGTSNAQYFDQAARNVACMAEAIAQAHLVPKSLAHLRFVVLAPEAAIRAGKFQKQIARASIEAQVKQRVSAYDGTLDKWYANYFMPTLDYLQLISLSWEETIRWIGKEKHNEASALAHFYERCLEFK